MEYDDPVITIHNGRYEYLTSLYRGVRIETFSYFCDSEAATYKGFWNPLQHCLFSYATLVYRGFIQEVATELNPSFLSNASRYWITYKNELRCNERFSFPAALYSQALVFERDMLTDRSVAHYYADWCADHDLHEVEQNLRKSVIPLLEKSNV